MHTLRSPGSKFKIKHISGKDNSQSVKENYGNNFCQAEVIEFSNNMDTLYNWSDIIISRAGSMTISEISKSGRTAILVPFLYATDNHQHRNAKYLVDNNAAIIIKEDSTFAENLTETLSELYNNQDWLAELAMNSKNLFPEDSSAIILGKIPELNEEFDYTTPKK